MFDLSREFEERLRRVQPRRVSTEMRDALGQRLRPQPVRRDWPMLCAIGSSLAAACVIVVVLIQQTPRDSPDLYLPQSATSPSQGPPAMYAFSSRDDSLSNDTWSVR